MDKKTKNAAQFLEKWKKKSINGVLENKSRNSRDHEF
jgi:hypothetical protein